MESAPKPLLAPSNAASIADGAELPFRGRSFSVSNSATSPPPSSAMRSCAATIAFTFGLAGASDRGSAQSFGRCCSSCRRMADPAPCCWRATGSTARHPIGSNAGAAGSRFAADHVRSATVQWCRGAGAGRRVCVCRSHQTPRFARASGFFRYVRLRHLFTQPHLYLPFAGPALVIGGALAAVGVCLALLGLRPRPYGSPSPAPMLIVLLIVLPWAAAGMMSREPRSALVAAR